MYWWIISAPRKREQTGIDSGQVKGNSAMKSIILLASILVLSFPSTSLIGRERLPVYDDSDGYQVMSVAVMNEAGSLGARQIVIYSRTVEQPDCRNVPEEFQAAARDLKAKSKVVAKLRRKFSLKVTYHLSQDWGADAFSISPVGFDPSRTHAVVTVFRGCGALCGSGGTYLVRKIGGTWKKVGRACELVS